MRSLVDVVGCKADRTTNNALVGVSYHSYYPVLLMIVSPFLLLSSPACGGGFGEVRVKSKELSSNYYIITFNT